MPAIGVIAGLSDVSTAALLTAAVLASWMTLRREFLRQVLVIFSQPGQLFFEVTPTALLGWVWVSGGTGRVRTRDDGPPIVESVRFARLVRAQTPLRLGFGLSGHEVRLALTVRPLR